MKALITIFLIFGLLGQAQSNELNTPFLASAEARQDLRVLYDALKGAHANLYANRTEAQYQSKYDEIKAQLSGELDQLRVKMLLQEFVAYGRIAHAGIDFLDEDFTKYRDAGGTAFPIYVRIEDGNWWITENYSDQKLEPGTRITHINNIPVSVLFQKIWRFLSADTEEIASSLLEYKLPQYLWLLDQNKTRLTRSFQVKIEDEGVSRELSINAITREQLQEKIDAQSSRTNSPEQSLREYKILSGNVGYLKPGPFYNAEDQTDLWNNSLFVKFIDESFTHFIANDVERLIIDVRKNPGGTNSFSDAMIAWYANKPFKFASKFLVRSSPQAQQSNQQRIESSPSSIDSASKQLADAYRKYPYGELFEFNLEESQPRAGARYEGSVYILIDRHSYSNAASVAAITQDYGFGKVVGQQTTDFATTYASMETFDLPNSKIRVGFPKAHIIRPSGDAKAGPVIPDIELDEEDSLSELLKIIPKH